MDRIEKMGVPCSRGLDPQMQINLPPATDKFVLTETLYGCRHLPFSRSHRKQLVESRSLPQGSHEQQDTSSLRLLLQVVPVSSVAATRGYGVVHSPLAYLLHNSFYSLYLCVLVTPASMYAAADNITLSTLARCVTQLHQYRIAVLRMII